MESLRPLLVASLLAAIAACSSGTPPATAPPDASDASTDVVITDKVSAPDVPPPTDVVMDTAPPLDIADVPATPDVADVSPPLDITDAPTAPDVPDVPPAPDVVDVACAEGQTRCGDTCVDTATDLQNCGACGARCCLGNVCSGGRCAAACSPGNTACGPRTGPDGCTFFACIDTLSDNNNCGACGTQCAAGQVCVLGSCLTPCAAGETRCGMTCVNLNTSNDNCGACGRRCCAGQQCIDGSRCVASCSAGIFNCPGPMTPEGLTCSVCRDLSTDANHCGACGRQCATGQVCVMGDCLAPCATGETRCGSACVNLQHDGANCGACGRTCGTGEQCYAGACRLPRSCDELLAMAPMTPSGAYRIDADLDGALGPFRVYCDMSTDGGGWTLIAASVGATNMPRFDTTASTPCDAAAPTGACFVGAAQLAALGLAEYRWSTTPDATATRAPIDNWRAGAPDVSAACVSATEYFRANQDIAAQGMAWSGCLVSEVFDSAAACQNMYRPVWNLQRCEGVPIGPGQRSSPDYNCSPFGSVIQSASAGTCSGFFNVRHWRRGRTCPAGQTYCNGACVDVQRDASHCGACGRGCMNQACVMGACATARSCADLLGRAPGTPSGLYPIDTDGDTGPNAPVRVYCDMATRGGGWTLVAAAVAGNNMPRFTEAPRPCNWATPNAPCVLGQANVTAMPFTEFAWSTTPDATDTRAPLTGHTLGAADVNATCANANEYFRANQDIASQGMGWTGCTVTEVYASTDVCQTMFRPIWNLQRCEGLAIAPGPRTSPDYNCSPFGVNLPFGGNCDGFTYVRHWRR